MISEVPEEPIEGILSDFNPLLLTFILIDHGELRNVIH